MAEGPSSSGPPKTCPSLRGVQGFCVSRPVGSGEQRGPPHPTCSVLPDGRHAGWPLSWPLFLMGNEEINHMREKRSSQQPLACQRPGWSPAGPGAQDGVPDCRSHR